MSGGPRPFGVDAEQVPAMLARDRQARPRRSRASIFFAARRTCAPRRSSKPRPRASSGAALVRYRARTGALDQSGRRLRHSLHLSRRPARGAAVTDHSMRWRSASPRTCPRPIWSSNWDATWSAKPGLYVSRVIDRKVSRGQLFLVVDGGMHQHLAASGNFGQVIRRTIPVAMNGKIAPHAPRWPRASSGRCAHRWICWPTRPRARER